MLGLSKRLIRQLKEELPKGLVFGDWVVVGREATVIEEGKIHLRVRKKGKASQWMRVHEIRRLIRKEAG